MIATAVHYWPVLVAVLALVCAAIERRRAIDDATALNPADGHWIIG